jgi:hypothetical protein
MNVQSGIKVHRQTYGQVGRLGLPFSDKKIIPRNTKQDGTDGSSLGITPVSRKRKTSEFRSEPFLGRENPWNSVPNHFRMINPGIPFRTIFRRENFGIPFQTIFGRKKNSEFHSEPFSEEKTLENLFQTIFGNRKHSKNNDFC